MWSVKTRPKPGSRSSAARLSEGVGAGCGSRTKLMDEGWDMEARGPVGRAGRADDPGASPLPGRPASMRIDGPAGSHEINQPGGAAEAPAIARHPRRRT